MPKFYVRVSETVFAHYPEVEIEADTEEEAEKEAEDMRVQGYLGAPQEDVMEVHFDIEPCTPAPKKNP